MELEIVYNKMNQPLNVYNTYSGQDVIRSLSGS